MRILIYGFGPYLQFHDNVTAKIVRALPRPDGVKKLVFPVRFHKGQFIAAVKDFKPDIVLGLGQCSRGRLLRQERRAVNRRRVSKAARIKRIAAGAPAELPTTLRLDLRDKCRWSRDAGRYVCNFSMYVMLDYIRRHKLPVRYGFIHVPHDYPYRTAVRAIGRALLSSTFKSSKSPPVRPRKSRRAKQNSCPEQPTNTGALQLKTLAESRINARMLF